LKKQFNVGLEPDLRAALNTAAERNGRSLAEEIRIRLESSCEADKAEKPDKVFLAAISNLIGNVRRQTGWSWHQDPFAHDVLRHATTTLLDRVQPREPPAGEPPRVPASLVQSTDAKSIGLGLETIAAFAVMPDTMETMFNDGPFSPDGVRELVAIKEGLAKAKVDKEANKANRKFRRRGKRGQS
jgi:hypothetical protein